MPSGGVLLAFGAADPALVVLSLASLAGSIVARRTPD
jgi:hypothetical protein